MNIAKILMISGWIVLSTPAILAAETTGGKPDSTSAADQKAIASAMSAAPKKVSAAATIYCGYRQRWQEAHFAQRQ